MLRHRVVLIVAIALVAVASFYPFAPSWLVVAGERPAVAELRYLADGDLPISLNFKGVDVDLAFEALAGAVPFEIEYEGKLPGALRIVSIEMNDTTVVEALERIAELTGLSYRVPDPRTLVVVAPRLAGLDGVTNPERIAESFSAPVYPEEARKEGITGKVFLEALIDVGGTVDRVKVLRGVPDHPEFAEAATAAILQWRYEPATRYGKPVPVIITVIINFTLDDKETEGEDEPNVMI